MITVIVNPIAGNSHSLKCLPDVERLLRERAIDYQVRITRAARQATTYAREACAAGVDGIAVMGGDGSISEVLNGLTDTRVALYYIPCGTGNDFVKVLHLPKDPVEALALQLSTAARTMDFGQFNDHRFMNIIGTGFDVLVLKKAAQLRGRRKGLWLYLCGVYEAIRDYRPFECEVSLDGGPFERRRLTLLSVGNGQYFGGGMRVTPEADPTDGQLDVVMIDAVSRLRILFYLPFFIRGTHTRLKITQMHRVKSLCIRRANFQLDVDGEIIDIPQGELYARVAAGALTVHCP